MFLGLGPPFSIVKASTSRCFFHASNLFSPISSLPVDGRCLKDSCDQTGPTWIIQGNPIPRSVNVLTSTKPLLPCRLHIYRFRGLQLGHFGSWGHQSEGHSSCVFGNSQGVEPRFYHLMAEKSWAGYFKFSHLCNNGIYLICLKNYIACIFSRIPNIHKCSLNVCY